MEQEKNDTRGSLIETKRAETLLKGRSYSEGQMLQKSQLPQRLPVLYWIGIQQLTVTARDSILHEGHTRSLRTGHEQVGDIF